MSPHRFAFVASLLAISCLALVRGVSAQSATASNPTGDYKLPGGLEPVVHLRTYYFDAESVTGTQNSAWALGGWAGVRSPWWGDMFRVGIVGYTSQRLYGPDDKDGTRLLAPTQDPINVIGEAYAAVRLFDQTFTGYRQRIVRPFISLQDNRMVPNTFEAYTLAGTVANVSYTAGYATKIKQRDSNNFDWMSVAAGGTGSSKGTLFAGGTWDFAKDGYFRADAQHTEDVFDSFYLDGKYPLALDANTALTLGAQYIRQKSTGVAQIGNFSTNAGGVQASLSHGPLGAQLMYTQTSDGFDTQNPFSEHPSYLDSMQVAFNSAGEKAWGVSGSVNFAGFGVPGLTAVAVYASGQDRLDGRTRAALPDRNEFDIRTDYAFPKGTVLEGLVATLRYSVLHQDGAAQSARQFRAYVNYDVRF